MGRILDLCAELVAATEDGPEGLVLPAEAWDKLREDWSDEEIEDGLNLVRDQVFQAELVEAADSLSARLVELLGAWGDERAWEAAVEGHARLPLDVIGQLARRVDRVEEILEAYRDDKGPDRRGFDELRQRLMNQGIEKEMARSDDEPTDEE